MQSKYDHVFANLNDIAENPEQLQNVFIQKVNEVRAKGALTPTPLSMDKISFRIIGFGKAVEVLKADGSAFEIFTIPAGKTERVDFFQPVYFLKNDKLELFSL